MKKLDRYGNVLKLIEIIRYLHANKCASSRDIIRDCKISEPGFYRHKRYAEAYFGLKIIFCREKKGFLIETYGLIDSSKL